MHKETFSGSKGDQKYLSFLPMLKAGEDLLFYRDGNYLYFMSQSLKNGFALLEESDNSLIVWDNELTCIDRSELYQLILAYLTERLILVYIESAEEQALATSLGGVRIDFYGADCQDYCQEFGSFEIWRKKV